MNWYRVRVNDGGPKNYTFVGRSEDSLESLAGKAARGEFLRLDDLLYQDEDGTLKDWTHWDDRSFPTASINGSTIVAIIPFKEDPRLLPVPDRFTQDSASQKDGIVERAARLIRWQRTAIVALVIAVVVLGVYAKRKASNDYSWHEEAKARSRQINNLYKERQLKELYASRLLSELGAYKAASKQTEVIA